MPVQRVVDAGLVTSIAVDDIVTVPGEAGSELHLGDDILVPDIAGWRRTTMPELPDDPFTTVRPDWACEVLSPSTAQRDRADKVPIYAREGVQQVWLVDPEVKTLEVLRLDGSTYRIVSTRREDFSGPVEPFEAIELHLAELWAR